MGEKNDSLPTFMSQFYARIPQKTKIDVCGLIFLLIATFTVVLFTCFISNEDEPSHKKNSDRVRARRVHRTTLCDGCEWYDEPSHKKDSDLPTKCDGCKPIELAARNQKLKKQ